MVLWVNQRGLQFLNLQATAASAASQQSQQMALVNIAIEYCLLIKFDQGDFFRNINNKRKNYKNRYYLLFSNVYSHKNFEISSFTYLFYLIPIFQAPPNMITSIIFGISEETLLTKCNAEGLFDLSLNKKRGTGKSRKQWKAQEEGNA